MNAYSFWIPLYIYIYGIMKLIMIIFVKDWMIYDIWKYNENYVATHFYFFNVFISCKMQSGAMLFWRNIL